MKELILSRGYTTVIDDCDYERASKIKWYVHVSKRHGLVKLYARHKSADLTTYLHRFIVGADASMEVDHKDGNGLNNLRSNPRIASSSQNKHNAILSRRNTSGFKGVCWHAPSGKWRVNIMCGWKNNYIGMFLDKVEAAKAYDTAAIKLHGEFARTNASMGLLLSST